MDNRDVQAAAAQTFNALAGRYGTNIFLIRTADGAHGYAAFQRVPVAGGVLSVAYIRGTGAQNDPLLPADAQGNHVVEVREGEINIVGNGTLGEPPVEGQQLANLIRALGDEVEAGEPSFLLIWRVCYAVAEKRLTMGDPQRMLERGRSLCEMSSSLCVRLSVA